MTSHRSDPGGRKRLLVLASTYPRWPGDSEPGFVHELARRLVDDFDVMALGPHAPGALTDEVMDGVRVHRYRYAPTRLETLVNDGGIVTNLARQPWKWLLLPLFLLGMLWSTGRHVRSFRPHAIHAHWLLPQGLAAILAGGGRPVLVTAHGADVFALRSSLAAAAKRFVVRRAAAVSAVSESVRSAITALGAGGQVHVRSMGVDLSGRFTPGPGAARSRDEILFVGRIVEKKGLRVLIEALPAVLEEFPRTFLTVAGFGPDMEACRGIAARHGVQDRVRFVGAVAQQDLPGFYRRAALLAAPFVEARGGDREGLGLVMVEAIGCGCPVVTTSLPTAGEVFGPAYADTTAIPGSAESLAGVIRGVLRDHDQALADTAGLRESLAARFDWRETASWHARMLSGIAARRPAPDSRS